MELFFQWLIERWESTYFVFLVRPYERAVHIRSGRLLRICKPGWYFKCPLEYDAVHKVNVVSTTNNLGTQVVTMKDGGSWVIGVVAKWRCKEEWVARLIIDVEDYEDVFNDTVYGMTARQCRQFDPRATINLDDLEGAITTDIRRRVGKIGIELEDLWITDIARARTLRLVTGDS
jgi:regulator of protease activity HflC (stomatin/prohibitin superfamily)